MSKRTINTKRKILVIYVCAKIKGKIEEGMLADFVVLDKSPFEVSSDSISKIKVLETYVGGEKVFGA